MQPHLHILLTATTLALLGAILSSAADEQATDDTPEVESSIAQTVMLTADGGEYTLRPEYAPVDPPAGEDIDFPAFDPATFPRLIVPPGAVDAPTELAITMLPVSVFNRLLYKRSKIAQHWEGREIGGQTFAGSEALQPLVGLRIEPSGTQFLKPLKFVMPVSVEAGRADYFAGISVDEEHDALLIEPGSVDATPTGIDVDAELDAFFDLLMSLTDMSALDESEEVEPESMDEGEANEPAAIDEDGKLEPASILEGGFPSFHTHEVAFELSSASTHGLVAGVRKEGETECIDAATACRCLRIRSSSAQVQSISVAGDRQCQITQIVLRTRFLDCPGQPVEEDVQHELDPECGDIEPIKDLLNYAPGTRWSFNYRRKIKLPEEEYNSTDDYQPCYTSVDSTAVFKGKFKILPEETADGNQALDASVSAVVSADYGGCSSPNMQIQPTSLPTTAAQMSVESAYLHWDSYVRPPSLNIHFRNDFDWDRLGSATKKRTRVSGPVWQNWHGETLYPPLFDWNTMHLMPLAAGEYAQSLPAGVHPCGIFSTDDSGPFDADNVWFNVAAFAWPWSPFGNYWCSRKAPHRNDQKITIKPLGDGQ